MATFLPNVTDVFAGVSDFDPDFNRIERMLKVRENAYQQGAKKVKGLYDSVFNSQMLRDQNIKTRDAYLKTISETLNALSSTDLSLPQNQQMATDLFNPVLTDNNLQKDIVYTRNFYDEMGKAEKLRTSTDDASRKRYNPISIKAMQYQAEEFKNADAATALGMSSPKYVQKIDMDALTKKLYKDAGISVKQDEFSKDGSYIFTKKNGDIALPISKAYVESMLSSDPGISDMLRTQAYVERKDFISQNSSKFGGVDKAERYYLENIIKAGTQVSKEQISENETEIKKLQDRMDSWNKKITTDGIVPGSDEHKEYLADLDKLQMAEQGLENKKNSLIAPENIDFNNIEELRQQADNLVTFSNYTMMANNIAQMLAYKNSEFTIKSDPISLARLRADLSLRNAKIMEQIRHDNDLEQLQKEIEAGKYDHTESTGTKTANGKDVKLTQQQMDSLLKREPVVIPDENNTEEATTEAPATEVEIRSSSNTGLPEEEEKTEVDPALQPEVFDGK
jgi:hypothetical protein